MIDLKSRVLRTLMPRKARHAVSYDTYAPTALLKCFSSILIRYQYKLAPKHNFMQKSGFGLPEAAFLW